MATLPSQGGSDGTWGTEVNAYLHVEHDINGTHNYFISWENDLVFYEGDIVTWQT